VNKYHQLKNSQPDDNSLCLNSDAKALKIVLKAISSKLANANQKEQSGFFIV